MKSPKILFSAIAMSLALSAAPAAFAQDAASQATPPPAGTPAPATSAAQTQAQGAAAQGAPTTQSAAGQQGTPPGAAPQAKQVTWADLDTDQNGKLSKAEVAPMPALTQAFEQVDVDKDGQMTPDEYKAFAQKQQAASPGGAQN